MGVCVFWGFGKKTGPRAPNNSPYRAFTKEFDELAGAGDVLRRLAPGILSEQLVSELRAPTVARVRATQRSLDFQSRLRAGHDLGERPLFTLLIDHSGSMRRPKAMAAATLADIAGAILEREHALFDILGFTTSSWKGGASRQRWLAQGSPANPGRLCDLLHIVYADAAKPHKRWQRELPLMLMPEVLKENVDGEALLWARDRAMGLNPTAWVCVHVSDGVPMDDATVLANGGEQNGWCLYKHLTEVIAELEGDKRIRLGSLSLDYDFGAYFKSSRRVDALNDSAMVLFDLLEDLIWPHATED